jgi:FemAB-related protein (PEP-CTERM system-associated)
MASLEISQPAAPAVALPEQVRKLTVRPYLPTDAPRWDRFVYEQAEGSPFHLTAWQRAIQRTFGYEPCHLLVERGTEITGVLPLFYVSNWLTGRVLLSSPLAVYGGICASDEASRKCLLEAVTREARRRSVEYLELRTRVGPIPDGFHHNSLYVSFGTELADNPEAMLKRIPRDTRYMIRKGEKAGLRIQAGPDELNALYPLFCQSMHRHGTPVFPRRLFTNLQDEFGSSMEILAVYGGNEPITAVASFYFRNEVLPYYAGAGPEAPRLAANNFMYWELMKRAARSGYNRFDFGRSKKGTGSYAFKTQWNMEVRTLDYQVFLVRRKTVPNFSPVNPKFERATRVWRRLPLGLANAVGPRVIRWLP